MKRCRVRGGTLGSDISLKPSGDTGLPVLGDKLRTEGISKIISTKIEQGREKLSGKLWIQWVSVACGHSGSVEGVESEVSSLVLKAPILLIGQCCFHGGEANLAGVIQCSHMFPSFLPRDRSQGRFSTREEGLKSDSCFLFR